MSLAARGTELMIECDVGLMAIEEQGESTEQPCQEDQSKDDLRDHSGSLATRAFVCRPAGDRPGEKKLKRRRYSKVDMDDVRAMACFRLNQTVPGRIEDQGCTQTPKVGTANQQRV
ncbi:uncharacterized protein PV09_03520 [Verruconis gallopava]|uniref:Uncharacterized protein n=1 Tax=Verruconis gallopava TaxID=253628 RepID=A0A0D2B2X1_9PEZI|nr:uncharacterized protein PV09_03520 [Verruconis gallopava]KIW05654.1 hypothetical protein PV09_03520 [Verruconis gallopava]